MQPMAGSSYEESWIEFDCMYQFPVLLDEWYTATEIGFDHPATVAFKGLVNEGNQCVLRSILRGSVLICENMGKHVNKVIDINIGLHHLPSCSRRNHLSELNLDMSQIPSFNCI